MEKRQVAILKAVIERFIEKGRPVSSVELYHCYDFGIKPAMIRSELHYLTSTGYLSQPHPSSGRVPTDKGYRYFVNLILEEKIVFPTVSSRLISSFLKFLEEEKWEEFLKRLSGKFGVISALWNFKTSQIYKEGLSFLLERLDWSSPEEITDIVRDFESLEERFRIQTQSYLGKSEIVLFIGERNPLIRNKNLSLLLKKIDHNKSLIVAALGPKRMNYPKVIQLFKGLE